MPVNVFMKVLLIKGNIRTETDVTCEKRFEKIDLAHYVFGKFSLFIPCNSKLDGLAHFTAFHHLHIKTSLSNIFN